MKAPIGADAESGLVHHVHGTAVNMADVTQVAKLLHGEENAGWRIIQYFVFGCSFTGFGYIDLNTSQSDSVFCTD